MSAPADILAQAILANDEAESVWERIHPDDARRYAVAQLAALDAAGYQIVQKPLDLTERVDRPCSTSPIYACAGPGHCVGCPWARHAA